MFNNVSGFMVKGFLEFGGLRLEEMIIGKLVGMGCDKSNIFQGHQMGCDLVIQRNIAPFMNEVHYFSHKTNLVIIILFDWNLCIT